MDMQMPVLDGYGATRALRRSPRHARLPVLALSAGAFRDQRERALAAGVNGFVVKPYTVDELVAAIVQALAQPDLRADGTPAESTASAAAGLNRVRGLQSFGTEAAWQAALHRFAEAQRQALDALPPDLDARAEIAHKLRGSAALLGLETLAEAAAAVESSPGDEAGQRTMARALEAALQLIDEIGVAQAAVPAPATALTPHPHAPGAEAPDLREALESDDYDRLAQALLQCGERLDPELLAALDRCLASYDFRGARLIFDAASRGTAKPRES